MAEYSFPWDKDGGGDAGPYEYTLFARFLASLYHRDGVFYRDNDGANTSLQVKQQTVADLSIRVAVGAAFVQGDVITERHLYFNDAFQTVDISENLSVDDRIDLIVLRLDYANQEVRLAAKAGTPAGSPVAPSLQQDSTYWEMALAEVAVASGASQIFTADITMIASNATLWPTNEGGTGLDAIAAGEIIVGNSSGIFAALPAAGDFNWLIGDSAKSEKLRFVSMRPHIIGYAGVNNVTIGTSLAGTVIDLDTTFLNPDSFITSLSANKFRLSAGYYLIRAQTLVESSAGALRQAIAWIHNATTTAVLAQGTIGRMSISQTTILTIPPTIIQSNGTDDFELRAAASGANVSSPPGTLTPSPTGGVAGIARSISIQKLKI